MQNPAESFKNQSLSVKIMQNLVNVFLWMLVALLWGGMACFCHVSGLVGAKERLHIGAGSL